MVRCWEPADHSHSTLPPIILLHDSLGCIAVWRTFPAELCAHTGHPVMAYDRFGFGQSDPHPETLALDFIANEAETDFAALRQQLGIDQFIVFGHSVGGGMAVHCAARWPEACLGLITESAQAFVEDRTLQGIEEAKILFAPDEHRARLRKYHGAKTDWVLSAWIDSWLHPAFASWSLCSVLPQVRCPALVIHGVDDEYGSIRHPTLISDRLGGTTQLEMMADTRHIPHRERQDAVIAMVVNFFASRGW